MMRMNATVSRRHAELRPTVEGLVLEDLDPESPAVHDLIELLVGKHVAVTSTLATWASIAP